MRRTRNSSLVAAAFIAALVVGSLTITGIVNTSASVQGWDSGDLPEGNMRQVPLDIKIVFVGIERQYVNTSDYFPWLLPPYHIQRETWYGTTWGVNYTFTYSYNFTKSDYENAFYAYLHSIRKDIALVNPYVGPPGKIYRFYDANLVEAWLFNNAAGYGGIPTKGYVFFLLNVTYIDFYEPENRPHYYNTTYRDIDSRVIVTRDWYGQWMTGWGGHHREYFIDVSAGESPISVRLFNPASRWWDRYFPPVWSLNTDLTSKNGVNVLNEYLSDFAFGAIYGLFTEDFIFPPRIAPNMNYNITITIFDNCTDYYTIPIDDPLGGTLPPYGTTFAVNKTSVLSAFQALIPYATWSVNLKYVHLNGTGDPEPYRTLWSVIMNAKRTQDSFGNPVAYIDRDQLYHYLQQNLADYIIPTAGQLLIPVFVFAFKNGYNLGYQYEGYEYDNYWGFGYPDVVLVSHSINDLVGGGPLIPFGFTQTIIHETGHSLGLIHPFWWDYDEDFVASPMAYYTYEYVFSQFDADAIQRGHADYYLTRALSMMENATELKEWKPLTPALLSLYSNAYGNLTAALSHYDGMDYSNSVSDSRTALNLFTQFVALASAQTPPSQPIGVSLEIVAAIGVVAIIFGLALGFIVFRRPRK